MTVAAEVAHDHVAVGREVPPLHRLEPLVGDSADREAGVDHRRLLTNRRGVRQLVAREPDRHAGVHRLLVGPDREPGEEAGVAHRVVRVEVVGLAPRLVAFDRVREVVTRIEDRHAGSVGPSRL